MAILVNATLEGTDWILSGTPPGTTISLVFANGAVPGFAGCNTHSSTYLTTMMAGPNNTISVGPVSSTQQLCSEEIMSQEQAYLAELETASQYTVSGDVLTLTTASGPLTFSAAVAALLTTQESYCSRWFLDASIGDMYRVRPIRSLVYCPRSLLKWLPYDGTIYH